MSDRVSQLENVQNECKELFRKKNTDYGDADQQDGEQQASEQEVHDLQEEQVEEDQ